MVIKKLTQLQMFWRGIALQVLCDIIQSNGLIGGPYVPLNERSDEPVEVVFCNPDLLWRSDFARPRLGQGAFKEAFQAVYKAVTGATYPYVQYGKPTKATYDFAQTVLADRLKGIYGAKAVLPRV
ncbi:hypothetical protein H0H87_004191 [Tephrocybe sp. NHM501043]|nr:hypothetical protein H0H87_004191 [Tephrocybe sp. NHM501043]